MNMKNKTDIFLMGIKFIYQRDENFWKHWLTKKIVVFVTEYIYFSYVYIY